MPISREPLPSRGNVGSTWPSAGRAETPTPERDPIDDAGDESFPCSDPPSWTLGRSSASRSAKSEMSAAGADPARLYEVLATEANEIPIGEVVSVEVAGREIAICRLEDEVFALSGSCSYHPIPLWGARLEGETLTCPWYGAQFDVRTGDSVFLSSAKPLTRFRTELRDGRIFVEVPWDPSAPEPSRWVGAGR